MSTLDADAQISAESGDGLLLRGLDGTNPLGFLAALGLLRVLGENGGTVVHRMSWAQSGGTWVPRLHAFLHDLPKNEDQVLEELVRRLVTRIDDHPANLLDELKQCSSDHAKRREVFERVGASNDPERMDWLVALASDFAPPDSINQLQTTRRDYFYGNVMAVIRGTTIEHLRRSIFHSWDYADPIENQSLHLDPSEDRRHAHQWNKPAGDPERKIRGGMLGANRLALEAIPLFSSFPDAESLHTVGFTGNRSKNTRWTWPIWSTKLPISVIRSLLASAALQKNNLESVDISLLRAQGIVAVYRTRRILVQKTPNFTPARRIA